MKIHLYDETIKKVLNIDDISKVRTSDNYLYNKLKYIVKKKIQILMKKLYHN